MMIGRVVLAAAGLLILAATPSAAQGLADIHTHVRKGNKICMADHFHSGNSAGEPSRERAEREAIASWQGFTGLEYGGGWASFRFAESRKVKCDRSGTGWACSVEARPCRRR